MVSATGYSGFLCFKPVLSESAINALYTFGGFHKTKSDLHIIYLHGFHIFPVYNRLVPAYINTMNGIINRNINSKCGITNKCGSVKKTGYIIGASSHSRQH